MPVTGFPALRLRGAGDFRSICGISQHCFVLGKGLPEVSRYQGRVSQYWFVFSRYWFGFSGHWLAFSEHWFAPSQDWSVPATPVPTQSNIAKSFPNIILRQPKVGKLLPDIGKSFPNIGKCLPNVCLRTTNAWKRRLEHLGATFHRKLGQIFLPKQGGQCLMAEVLPRPSLTCGKRALGGLLEALFCLFSSLRYRCLSPS